MKKIAILFLVFSFLIPTNCKKQTELKESKAEELVEEEELVQLEGYRDTKWGMTKEEVVQILTKRGLKKIKVGRVQRRQLFKSAKMGIIDIIERAEFHEKFHGKFYEMEGSLIEWDLIFGDFSFGIDVLICYDFKENKLDKVEIVFLDKSDTTFLRIKEVLNIKYKAPITLKILSNIQYDIYIWGVPIYDGEWWETSDTIICLAKEEVEMKKAFEIMFGKRPPDNEDYMVLYYYNKEEFMKNLKRIEDKGIKERKEAFEKL